MRRPFSNITCLPVLLLFSFAMLHAQTIGFDGAAPVSGAEASTPVLIPVTLTGYISGAIKVDYTYIGTSTATNGTDYSLTGGTLTFTGNGTQNISITIHDESTYEANETIDLFLALNAGSDPATVSPNTHTYTINNDDAAPAIQFTSASGNGLESTSPANLQLTLSAVSGLNASVSYNVTGGTASGVGVDYTLASGTATITAGVTTTNIQPTIVNDILDEDNETIVVTISAPSGASLGVNQVHTYTITDDDTSPTIEFSSASTSQTENVAAAVIQVTLSEVSGRDVSVNYSVAGSSTAADHNLTAGSTTVTAGQLTKDINFTLTNDVLNEDDPETIVVTLASPTNATLGGTTTHTFNIGDNDPTPTVQFTATSSNGFENSTPVNFELTLSAESGRDVTVDYDITGGTATGGGEDYTLASGTATILEGATTTNISATVNDETLDEAGETFEITISSPANASLGGNQTHTYTIDDNDDPPTIEFSTATSSGDESSATPSLTVSLSALSGQDVTVNYAVTGGDATGSGTDFTLAAGVATIMEGALSTTIDLTVEEDALFEANETVIVTLSGPANATLGGQTDHTYTINDNDAAPNVAFTLATSSGDEAIAAPAFEVSILAISGLDVTVDYAVSGGTATAGVPPDDFTLAPGTATISAGLTATTFAATINDDAFYESGETIIISLSNPGNATPGAQTVHTYTINDNDAVPTIELSGANPASSGETTASVNMNIVLSAQSGLDASVDYAVTGTASGGGIDHNLADGTATITAGNTSATLNITINNDTVYEGDETIILTLSGPGNATPGPTTSQTYTIIDNEVPPVIQFTFATSGGDEATTPASLVLSLDVASAVDATVDYAVTGGDATSGGVDYTLASGIATVTAGLTTTTIDIAVVDDIIDESPETVIVTISNPTDATLGATTDHTYTISDNDDPPTVEFAVLAASGDEAVTPAELIVQLSAASANVVTVDYAVDGGGSTATGGGVDYSLTASTLTFNAGETADTISVTIVDDDVVETDEIVAVALSNPVNGTLGAKDTLSYTILNDDAPPVDFTVGAVAATGGADSTGYWNAGNTGLEVTVPVDNSPVLTGGTIQLQAKADAGSFENLGAASAIVVGDLGTDKTLTITAAEFEAITGFAEGAVITITAIITDAAGNSTTGTASVITITVDQTAPAAFTTGLMETSGGDTVTGYWNATNSGISVVVPLVSDASLSGGSIQLQAEAGGAFEDLGVAVSIIQTDVNNGSKTILVDSVEVSATGVEELTGYSEGDELTFRSVLTDVAGNFTPGSVSSSTLTVDETAPAAALTYSDTLASQDDTVTITVTFDEAATSKPRISIAYAVNTVPATDMDSTSTTVWTYDAIIPGGNDGLATVTITGTDRAGNALTAGNTTGRTRLLLDNTPPGYVLSYSDSLVKEGDPVTITATVEESVQLTPTITILFAGSGPNITDADMSMASDSIWTYDVEAPTGNDGFATVTITALDLAGNAVTLISGSTGTLKVDNTPPTITPSSPVDEGFVRTTAVTYALGETVASGQVTWTLEGGATDGNSPHIKALTGTELIAGTHTGVLTNAPTLVQAAEYTIQFIAWDYAGNADTVAVSTVTYDTLAPDTTGVVVSDGPAADIDSTSSADTLTAHWAGFSDPVAGIALYEYAVGTARGDTDVVSWTGNDTDTMVTVKGLQLTHKRHYYVSVRATDGAGNVSDSVSSNGVRIVDRPRLTVNVVQNSFISEYVQIFVIDTLAMADSISIVMDSLRVSVTEIDTFAYGGTHKYTRSGSHSLEVTGFSGWGDTTRTSSLAMALAKQGQPWVAASVDRRFTTAGSPGSVSSDRYLLVVDSTLMGLSAAEGGAYRLGDGQFTFDQPVRVSMRRGVNEAGREAAQAIYVLRSNGSWEELPSVNEGELVTSWTNRAGTFRLGRRTIIVPQATSLHQNYPNPFNPTTRIVFDLGFQDGPRQHARVVIYNLLGQEVLTLYDGEASTGRYELTWQGVDARGLAAASGVYFVRLSTGAGHQITMKMLLVR